MQFSINKKSAEMKRRTIWQKITEKSVLICQFPPIYIHSVSKKQALFPDKKLPDE